MAYAETLLAIFFGLIVILWLSVRMRKGFRWFVRKGLTGISLLLLVFGALLLFLAFLVNRIPLLDPLTPYLPYMIKWGTLFLIVGAILLVIDQLYRSWKKERLLSLEEERRRYIERIRFGLTVDDAEKIAKQHIKKVTGLNTKLVASKKEFKHWAVYLKDRNNKYYRVVINAEGKIEEWQTMDEIPSYILSP